MRCSLENTGRGSKCPLPRTSDPITAGGFPGNSEGFPERDLVAAKSFSGSKSEKAYLSDVASVDAQQRMESIHSFLCAMECITDAT